MFEDFLKIPLPSSHWMLIGLIAASYTILLFYITGRFLTTGLMLAGSMPIAILANYAVRLYEVESMLDIDPLSLTLICTVMSLSALCLTLMWTFRKTTF